MHINPFTPCEYEGLAAFYKILFPQINNSVEDIRKEDEQRDKKYLFKRWLAIDHGTVVGVGYHNQSNWFAGPQNFFVWIGVLPDYQRKGIGSSLYQSILDNLQPHNPHKLRAFSPADRPHSIAFLKNFGFQEVIRDIQSELDVQSFDFSQYKNHKHAYLDDGISIKTVPELEDDPERNMKLYNLDWDLSMAVPGELAAGMGRRGLDQYVKYAITGDRVPPEAFFVAVKGDEYIGMSHILISEKGVSFYQGLTGVIKGYQRKGLGLALKLKVIEYAQENGYALIRSENDAKNTPMLKLNEKLGFVRKSELITFEKNLQLDEQ